METRSCGLSGICRSLTFDPNNCGLCSRRKISCRFISLISRNFQHFAVESRRDQLGHEGPELIQTNDLSEENFAGPDKSIHPRWENRQGEAGYKFRISSLKKKKPFDFTEFLKSFNPEFAEDRVESPKKLRRNLLDHLASNCFCDLKEFSRRSLDPNADPKTN